MKRYALAFLLLFISLLSSCNNEEKHEAKVSEQANEQSVQVPQRVIDVYREVLRTGKAPAGYVGGRRFENREHRLPPDGSYHEYDVNPKVRGENRGAERIIIDARTGEGWYTADHYRTFTILPPAPGEQQ